MDVALKILAALLLLFAGYVLFLFVCSRFVDKKKEYTEDSAFYRLLLYGASAAAIKLLGVRVHTTGLELLPKGTNLMFVGNHLSNFDPIIQWLALKEWRLAFVSKKANFGIPIFGRFIRRCCFLEIDRENPLNGMAAIGKATKLLRKGELSVGVYPEGTRNRTKRLLPFHNVVFRMAIKAEKPVAVMAIRGTEEIHKNVFRRKSDVYLDIIKVIPAEEVKEMKYEEIGACVRAALEEKLYATEEAVTVCL